MTERTRMNVVSRRGFTLVELAIVMVIAGLLIGLGSGMVGPLMNMIKIRESKDSLDANVQAIASYASSHNSIPDATTGATGFSSAVKSPQDSWGRDFVYLYDATLNAAPISKDTICGRRSTTLTVHTLDPTASATINNIAYIVLSPSDDAAVNATLTATTGPPLIAATLNTLVSGPAIATATRGSATGTVNIDANNSDIVRWVTLDELRSKAGCQGAPLKIVNNELPYGSITSSTYSAKIVADGGVPNTAPDYYGWCVQTTTVNIAPAGLTFQKPDASGTAIQIPSVTNLFQTNCSTYPLASWPQAGQLVLSGTPTATGSYYFNVYVSDTNGNQASKPFVLTVNP